MEPVTSAFLGVLLSSGLLAAELDAAPATELRYNGSLVQQARDGAGTPVKRFSVYCLVLNGEAGAREVAFLVDEQEGGGWAWPERYGVLLLDPKNKLTNKAAVALLHEHDGTHYPLTLAPPFFEFADQLKEGAAWTAGKYEYEVGRPRKVKDRDCWQVEVSTNFGRMQTLSIDKATSLLVAAEQRVFMGRGDQFLLKFELESTRPVEKEQLIRLTPPLETLLALQRDLKRVENEMKPELSGEQLQSATAVLARLEKEADGTPFARLAGVISRDVKTQLERADGIAGLAKKFVGQPAPKLELKSLAGAPLDLKEFEGKIVVLHFWDYKGEPLAEPYGQVGYLDFLNSRRKKLGVKVVGVAVHPSLSDPQKAAPALRSIRKLQSFMNLSYDLAGDDGTLLKEFGDPRRLDAKLPLWVVVAPDGKIAHYSVGYFSIKPDEGLRQLDDLVVELIKKQRGSTE
jgi:hypothetical protein